MGLKEKLKNAAFGNSEQRVDRQRRRDIDSSHEVKGEFYKGYEKAAKRREYERGERAARGNGNSRGGMGGAVQALGGSISNTEKAFGFDKGGVGGGLDFGFGGGMFGEQPAQKKAPPMRETRITKSGTVVIREPVAKAKPKQQSTSPYGWMDDVEKNSPF